MGESLVSTDPAPLSPPRDALRGSIGLRLICGDAAAPSRHTLPISAALLDQSLFAGIGNIAKSEILFQTGLDPGIPANEVAGAKLDRLLKSIRMVLWASYHVGGRWVCRVYHRSGQQCEGWPRRNERPIALDAISACATG